MPQIQSGQVEPGQNGAPQLYGVNQVENTIPFQERLFKRFKPQEFVRIKNVCAEPVYWQYLPPEAEEIAMTQDGLQKIITRGTPEMWVINPGEEEVLVGANAYLALDAMYKNFTARKVLRREGIKSNFDKENQHIPRNFNFADGGLQEEFINIAYLGTATPTFGAPMPTVPAETGQTANTTSVDTATKKTKETSGAGVQG